MDDLHPRLQELLVDVKDIKTQQIELIKQGAVHNQLLKEHERRSLALEQRLEIEGNKLNTRLQPIERHVSWVDRLIKASGAVLIFVAGHLIVKYFNG